MKHHDDRQWTLFGEPQAVAVDEPEPRQRPPFDPLKLRITEHEGEPCVLENDIGEALGYKQAHYIQRLIDRLEKLPSWGPSGYRVQMVEIGSGAHREVRQRVLTEKQVVRVCMAARLPNFDEVQSLIADVFIAWRHGRLRAADAHTEAKLQEATDRAFDEFPALFAFCQEIQETGKAARAAKLAAERAARAAEETIANQRRYPEAETVRGARWVNKHNYRDHCPCCERVWLGPNGGVWAHMKGKFRRTIRDGWFVCKKCNLDWENPKNTIEINIKFVSYVGHVEAYLAQGQFHFGRKP